MSGCDINLKITMVYSECTYSYVDTIVDIGNKWSNVNVISKYIL